MPWLGMGFFFLIYLFWERRRVNKALKETRTRLQHTEELLLEVCAVLEGEEDASAQPEENPAQREPFTTSQNLSIPAKVEIRKQTQGRTSAGTTPTGTTQTRTAPTRTFSTTEAKVQDVGDGSFLLENTIKNQIDSGVRSKSTGNSEPLNQDKKKPAPPRKKGRGSSAADKTKSGSKQKTVKTKANKESKEMEGKKSPKQINDTTSDQDKKRREHKPPKRNTSIKKEVESSESSSRHQTIIDLYKKGVPVKDIARQVESGQGEIQLIIDLYLKK